MAVKSNEERRVVQVSGTEVPYYLKLNANQKNLILKVKEGDIHISAPIYTPEYQIETMIRKHYSKISKLQTTFEMNNKYDLYSSKPWIKIFDQKVPIHLSDQNINTKIEKDGIYMKNYNNTEEQLKKIYSFLAKYYKNWFINKTFDWAQIMGLEFKGISVKNMTAKWGACYSREGKIIYNTKLLHFSKEVIESVIVHELSHLVHPNHSQQFWNLVYKVYPKYKEMSAILDKAGI